MGSRDSCNCRVAGYENPRWCPPLVYNESTGLSQCQVIPFLPFSEFPTIKFLLVTCRQNAYLTAPSPPTHPAATPSRMQLTTIRSSSTASPTCRCVNMSDKNDLKKIMLPLHVCRAPAGCNAASILRIPWWIFTGLTSSQRSRLSSGWATTPLRSWPLRFIVPWHSMLRSS